MTRRLIRWSAAAMVLIAALLLGIWLGRGPSVRPEDVRLEAVLHHPGHGENLLAGDAWSLAINLKSESGEALWTDDWSHAVTPIIGGMAAPSWDFFQGWTSVTQSALPVVAGQGRPVGSQGLVVKDTPGRPVGPQGSLIIAEQGRPVGGEGFVVLRDESVRSAVARAMPAEGLNVSVQRWDEVWGFRYHGDSFPVRIRYYLDGGEPGIPEGIAVAYTHKERWLGRDLSWTKIVRAVPAEGAAEWKPDDELTATAAFLPNKDAVLGRDEFGPGQLGELKFQRGQVLVWRPEPDQLATTAVFLTPKDKWEAGNSYTSVSGDPNRTFTVSAQVNPPVDRERKVPLWAIFGQVTDPEIAYVLVVIPGEQVSKMVQVEQGVWVRAHLGEIPGGEVTLEYMTRSFGVKERGKVRTPRP